jgi:hypothetical protein
VLSAFSPTDALANASVHGNSLAAGVEHGRRDTITTRVLAAVERCVGDLQDTLCEAPLAGRHAIQPAEAEARGDGDAFSVAAEARLSESADRRAEQTAAPLVERMQRVPVVFHAAEARATAARALHEHAGGTILIIASGAALPQMGQKLTGSRLADAAADDADVIYVVSVPSIGLRL